MNTPVRRLRIAAGRAVLRIPASAAAKTGSPLGAPFGSRRAGRVRLMRMVAVVLGGGMGQRLGADMPKQLLTLGGKTLVERCVAAFQTAPGIDEILVVMARGYTGQVEALLAKGRPAQGGPAGGYPKVTGVIEGGRERPDSVRAALAAIASRVAED